MFNYVIIGLLWFADYPIHIIFCFIGGGRNGKTKFQELLSKFIGIDNISSTELDTLLDSRFESAKLYRKLVCVLGETNFGVINKTSLLKKLTGQDLIGYEFKNKNPFDHYNYAKILINSNSLPTSEDTSEGFYRRWMIIDFPNTFPEGKDILEIVPKEEYSNLALKVTKILPKLLERGNFINQGSIEERKRRDIIASNPLTLFIEKYYYENPEGYIRYSELYTDYVKYLNKIKKRIISKREFTKTLESEGYEIRRTTKTMQDFDEKRYETDRWVEGLGRKKGSMTVMPVIKESSLSSHIRNKSIESSDKCHNSHNLDKIQEELVVDQQLINHKCYICDSTPCVVWSKTSKPLCAGCQEKKETI